MTRLSVWYLRTLLDKGEIRGWELPVALCKRVNLYRFTDLWNGVNDAEDGSGNAQWMTHATQIARWVCETPMQETDCLEEQVLAFLKPLLERRLPKDIGPPPVRPFECWTYELGWPGLADGPGFLGKFFNRTHRMAILRKVVRMPPSPSRDGVLHIMNVMTPQSPFDDLPRLAHSLRALIAHIRSEQPQVHELWCNTWLNEHENFRELLPEIWFLNATVAPPGPYRNWWGQFARRDGDFNQRAAQRFRAAGGVFPFRALLCHASLKQIEAHLASRFPSRTS